MDEIQRGQEELMRRREQHEREAGSRETVPLPDLVRRHLADSSPSTSARRSSVSGAGEAQAPPEPRTCEYCEAAVPWLEVRIADRVRYAPGVCDCAGAQAARVAAEDERRRATRHSHVANLLHGAGLLSGKWSRMTLETWERDRNLPSSRSALETALEYVRNVPEGERNWLYLHGPYGTGKTHLAVAIVRQLAFDRLWMPRAVVWPEHCAQVQESWDDSRGPTEAQLWGRMRRAKVLLIDDLDKRRPSAWAAQKLFEVIERRYREERPTIITANRSLEALDSEWGNIWMGRSRQWEAQQIQDATRAIISRIVGQLWGTVEMTGQDQRW